jgi:hypothetical protein
MDVSNEENGLALNPCTAFADTFREGSQSSALARRANIDSLALCLEEMRQQELLDKAIVYREKFKPTDVDSGTSYEEVDRQGGRQVLCGSDMSAKPVVGFQPVDRQVSKESQISCGSEMSIAGSQVQANLRADDLLKTVNSLAEIAAQLSVQDQSSETVNCLVRRIESLETKFALIDDPSAAAQSLQSLSVTEDEEFPTAMSSARK